MINLKAARLKAGMTMKELGACVGISESSYCLIENGKRGLKLELACRLASALGCKIDDLLEKEESA